MRCSSLVAIAAFIVLVSTVFGQGTGTIFGLITDPSGAAIPAAKVTALLVDRGQVRTVESNERGD